MFSLLIGLIVLYLIFQLSFQFVSHGHTVEYTINADKAKLEVKEVYTRHRKNERDNYYFEIQYKDQLFTIQLFDDLKKRNYVIQDIAFFSNDTYTCIYPTFKGDKQLTDILCMKENIIYPYQTIKGKNKEVDQFKESLKEIYSEEKFKNDLSETLKKESLTIYRNNILPNHFLALENYKGLYLINTKDIYKKVELFENDKYKKEVSHFDKNKYITADYNQSYSFNEFYVVDMKSGKLNKIINHSALSLDAYVMGSVQDKVYIYDRKEKEQYAVDLKNNNIRKIGNTSSGIKVYLDREWKDYSSYDAYEKKTTFTPYRTSEKKEGFSKIDKVGNTLSGYYYLYQKEKNHYRVYRSPVQHKESLTYLFDTTSMDNIIYEKDYIYFINENDLCYYDNYSVKKVLTNKEFEFNQSLKFGLFID